MCAGPFRPSSPPPPPPPQEDLRAVAQRKRERIRQQEETTKLKEQRYEERVASAYGRRGRRSLLSGRRGGTGFQLQENLMSKKTLGA
tara:strand:- start:628 stop:888 length:261 start_codon:yes stop_codon:yes gene_type:complete